MNKIFGSSDQQSKLTEQDDSNVATAIATTPKKRFPWIIPVLVAVIILGAGIYLRDRRKDTQHNMQSPTVPVQTQSLQVSFEASGSIEPITAVNISPKTTGRLTALHVEQGDKVKAGQLLARMDSANLTAELVQAQAELAQAQADLSAKRLEKNRWLAQQGAIAQLTLEEYLSEDQTSHASLAEAEEQLRELESGNRPEDIAQSKAQVAAAKARVDLAQTELSDTAIYAPFNGIISQKYATVGAVVTPNVSASTSSSATSSSILSIASGLEVKVKVSEATIARIKPHQTVEIVAEAYPYQTFQGRVKQIAPEAIVENNVTSFEVKVELITGQTKLRSGMNVDAVFAGEKIDNALTIPTVAITTNKGKIGVMVLGDRNQAKFKPVRVGFSENGQTQIIQGLTSGDRVFIDFPPGQAPIRTGLP